MAKYVLFVAALALGGCLSSNAVDCGDGLTCPAGTTCRQLTNPDAPHCATAAELAACSDIADGEGCERGYCHDGVCLPIVCGNGRVDRTEVCDDGNTITGDTTCSGDCRSNEQCGNGTVDPLRIEGENIVLNERCDDGNFLSGDGCASNCSIEEPRWEEVGLTQPPAVFAASISFDIARRRVVMFGGGVTDPNSARKVARSTTYEWDGRAWIAVPAGLRPGPRWSAAFAYDAKRHRHVMFGGQDLIPAGEITANGFRETWEWDGSRWDLRALATNPIGRIGSAMAFDSKRGVVVLFGGRTLMSTGGTLSDTWEYDGVDWKLIATPMSPPARAYHAMAYDPKRGVTVMAGGEAGILSSPTAVVDTWEYDGITWVPKPAPPAEIRHTQLAYDAKNSRLMTYGGGGATTFGTTTLAYNGTWSTLTPASNPGPRRNPSLASDPISGTIVLFGGQTAATLESAETWVWTGINWTGPTVAPSVPTSAVRAASAYDPTRGVAWLFGAGSSVDQLWSFDGVSWQASLASPPPGRNEASLVYDIARDELVLTGGIVADPATWLYDLATGMWRSTTPNPSPPGRETAVSAYDVMRQRTVLHAGTSGPTFLKDVWEWDGSAWVDRTPAASPLPPRSVGSAAYHPGIGVLIQNGYYNDALLGTVLTSDLWGWDGSTWTELVAVSPVASRGYGTLIYSGGLNRAVDFAGLRLGGQPFDDTWEYDGTSWVQSLVADPPPARGAHVSFPGRNGSDVMVFGGARDLISSAPLTDLWRYRYQNEAPRELCTIDADNDGDNLAGCADPDCWATCAPLCPPSTIPGTTCPADGPRCGDGVCNTALENCRICDSDCDCPAVCGDSFCDAGESAATCAGDCP